MDQEDEMVWSLLFLAVNSSFAVFDRNARLNEKRK